jgi:hypothetical protein
MKFLIPTIADQFSWGQRIHQLGLGLPFVSRPRSSRAGLAAAL